MAPKGDDLRPSGSRRGFGVSYHLRHSANHDSSTQVVWAASVGSACREILNGQQEHMLLDVTFRT